MKTTTRKLTLGRETLRTLRTDQLAGARGGGLIGQIYHFLTGSCWCPPSDFDDANGSGGVRG